jgi:hypothetical protein
VKHPLLALERVASATGRQLILETGVDMAWFKKPLMAFIPARRPRATRPIGGGRIRRP